MSRCYPYPPPGYIKNGIRDEALIESIKLQRKDENSKKERKKEKKREKKEKEKAWENGDVESKKHSHKRRHKDNRSQEDVKGGGHQKRCENETEHFEKSSLTEEHGHPVGSQNSTDSTLNSNKRQKQSSPSEGRQNSGSIIRIKLPLQRHKDPEVLPSNEQPCSASGRSDDTHVQRMHEPTPLPGRQAGEHPCSTSRNTKPELTFRISKGKVCPSSGAPEIPAHKAKAALPSNLCGSCCPQLALQFRDLIEKWVPPPMQSECTDLDQDWLFETKQNHNKKAKKSEDDGVCLGIVNSTPWPRACYLPEADIYALPFTVPF